MIHPDGILSVLLISGEINKFSEIAYLNSSCFPSFAAPSLPESFIGEPHSKTKPVTPETFPEHLHHDWLVVSGNVFYVIVSPDSFVLVPGLAGSTFNAGAFGVEILSAKTVVI